MSSNNPSIQAKSGRYVVASTFRSVNDFSRVYSEGEDVSTFNAERLTDLVKRGLVKFIPDETVSHPSGDGQANEDSQSQDASSSDEQSPEQPEDKPKRGKKPKE